MVSPQQRHKFAEFLDELAVGHRDPAKWFELAVVHYPDERLEEIRRDLVRMDIAERFDVEQLRQWATELRTPKESLQR